MRLDLHRKYLRETYTIGHLSVNGVYFCDTLEDRVRERKIPGLTAIPSGMYVIELSMSPKFKRLLPLLLDVPHFTGIRIHRGNTAEDSSGCILVGENKFIGKVINSGEWEERLVGKMSEAISKGEEIVIYIWQ